MKKVSLYWHITVVAGLLSIQPLTAQTQSAAAAQAMKAWTDPFLPNDLLLIYNTNSTDSATVLNYYLAHRPGVGGANVLGIGCPGFYVANHPSDGGQVGATNITDYETVSPLDFTNQVLNPVLNWLTVNPTKRPQFVILMLDVPSRVYYTATNAARFPFYVLHISDPTIPSVSYQLATTISGWQPFVTHINMGGTNDCIGYINKLLYFGATNYSPINLTISASANGYGNTNWYFDDTVYPPYSPNYFGFSGAQALIKNGGYSNSVIYTNVNPDVGYVSHIVGGQNVAGYCSWGSHGSLGVEFPWGKDMPWSGNSGWWIIETVESFNGCRYKADQSTFVTWSYSDSFGGTNYSNTPIGMVSHTDEPTLGGVSDPAYYFPYWNNGKCFAICAWASLRTSLFQVVGDPFVTK